MGKKLITAIIVAQIEVPTEAYEGMTDDQIKKAEETNWQEWICDHVVSEEITVKDVE